LHRLGHFHKSDGHHRPKFFKFNSITCLRASAVFSPIGFCHILIEYSGKLTLTLRFSNVRQNRSEQPFPTSFCSPESLRLIYLYWLVHALAMSYNSNVRYTEGRGGNQARNPMDIRGLLAPPTEQNPVYSSRNYERGNTAHKPEQPSYSQLCLEPGNALPVPPMPRDGSTSPQQPHSPRSMVSRSSGEYPQVSYHSSPYYHSSVSGGEYSYQQQHHGSRDTAPLSPGQGRTEASSVARSVRPKKALKGVAGAYPCACGRVRDRSVLKTVT